MARPYVVTYTDAEGKKIKRRFRSGVGDILHYDVTPEYEENVLKPIKDEWRKQKEQLDKDSKIQQKLKEMAEKELEKEEGL